MTYPLDSVAATFWSAGEIRKCDHSEKGTQYFSMVLLIILYKVVLIVELKCLSLVCDDTQVLTLQ